jgi:subtilisin family serine protease
MKSLVALAAGLLALAVTTAAGASESARHAQSMRWFRWQPPATAHLGPRAVLGVETMLDLAPLRAQYHFRLIRALPSLHAAEIRPTRALLRGARLDPRIRYLSPLDASSRLLWASNAPLLSDPDPTTGLPYEWQFATADVGAALDLSPGSASVLVGTIDSGTAEIPDLIGKVDSRWTVSPTGTVSSDSRGDDYLGHGTAVASLIAGNGFGMAGFGGATDIVSIRAPVLTDVAVATALMKLDSLGVRIVNMSFGQTDPERPIMLDAIHKAEADGMLLIAAAGNSTAPVAHPAADLQAPSGQESDGLAVGASDASGKLAYFSNSGDNLSLVAPGTYLGRCSGVLVAAPINPYFVSSCYPSWKDPNGISYAYVSGTSFAAPEVAGIAALIWAVRPTLTNYQVADIIKQSARRTAGWTPAVGCGTLDAGAALALAVSRSAAQWAATTTSGAPCSAGG